MKEKKVYGWCSGVLKPVRRTYTSQGSLCGHEAQETQHTQPVHSFS